MSIQCKNCGGQNNMPEGQSKMFCAYCGLSIELPNDFKPKDKPVLNINVTRTHELVHNTGIMAKYKGEYSLDTDGSLELINRGVESLDDIIAVLPDNELAAIKTLNLSGNNIKSLKGLSRFRNATLCYFNNNKITEIDDLPVHNHFSLVLENNNIKEISDLTAKLFNNRTKGTYNAYSLYLKGNNNFNIDSLNKIEFEKICDTFFIDFHVNETLKKRGFKNNVVNGYISSSWSKSNKNCFIATATLNSNNHPLVQELRCFRDEWILTQSWGASFVNWYYIYGAIAAKVIDRSTVLKKISYFIIIKPLVYLSRILRRSEEKE